MLQRLSPSRVVADSRALAARVLLFGIRDPAEARRRAHGLFGFVMTPPDAREVFDAIRATLAARIGPADHWRRDS